MKKTFLFILLAFPAAVFPGDWANNDVIKFTPAGVQNFDRIRDYENILVLTDRIAAAAPTNAWLESYPIDVGSNYILSSAFINLENANSSSSAPAQSYAVLKVKNSGNNALIQQKTFTRSGKIDLLNVFNKDVTVMVEIVGQGISVLSYGLTRKPEVVMTDRDLVITPPVLFFSEQILRVSFSLRYPALLDVILFDRHGKIVDVIAKNAFFSEGDNSLYWEPGAKNVSGKHQIYFKVRSTDGKELEIVKDFIFVNK